MEISCPSCPIISNPESPLGQTLQQSNIPNLNPFASMTFLFHHPIYTFHIRNTQFTCILYNYIYIYSIYRERVSYDRLPKCLFPVLLINLNSMCAASCLPLKNMTYLDDVKTWKFFVTFGNLSKTTGVG